MRNITGVIALLLLSSPSISAQQPVTADMPIQHNLMPVPAMLRFQPGRLYIDSSFRARVDGHNDERLRAGLTRVILRLERRTGMELTAAPTTESQVAGLVIRCSGPGKSLPSLDEDESYSLDVSDRGALLKVQTVVGALRGLETFLQLLESDAKGYFMPAVSINDKPRFPWRGLLIDVARHFEPIEVLKRNLDAMAAVKLNVLHWHLTDDQGFRIESKRYPRLHEMGSDGPYYTQEQAREIIAYARDRGIRVMPEFDMPGHVTSWLVGHPELGSAPGPYRIERKAGIMLPAFDPTRENTYKFLEGFFAEMSALFPDAYVHIGGDENEGHQWTNNSQIQAFMKSKGIKDNHALQAYFNRRISGTLQRLGKKVIGWEEILHPDLPRDTVVQSWRGPKSLAEAARKGYDGILSAGFYIDLNFPAWQHYAVDPTVSDSNLSEQELKHILGGEATMWGEWVGPETIDSRIWPRTAAIAERLWSPSYVKDVNDMYRRLDMISIQLEELGLTHQKNVDMLLRRMAATDNIEPLKTLVSVVEPVKEYRRAQAHPATMLTPLSRLIDAARPDSAAARRFAALVDGLLSDAPYLLRNREQIESTLRRWGDVRPMLEAMIEKSPVLREGEQLPRDLSAIGAAGLEALSYIAADVEPPAGWRADRLAMLEQAAKPKAEVEFAVIAPVKTLVILAAEFRSLKSIPPSQWRSLVLELSAKGTN